MIKLVATDIDGTLIRESSSVLPEEIFDLARGPFAEAVEELEKDDYIKNVLGGHITEKYLEAKRAEWADYRAQVTEWEIEKYLYKI